MRRFVPFILMFGVVVFPLIAQGALNDTGASLCSNGSSLAICDQLNAGDDASHPRQDGRFGRDAAASADTLVKTGGGAVGFDFTRICRSGDAAGDGSCPAVPVVGAGNDDWGCTRDNVTGLVWEVKTSTNNGDTMSWADAANHPATLDNLCGLHDWRLPERRELYSITHLGRVVPALDAAYFPNIGSSNLSWTYWAEEPVAGDATRRWGVSLNGGASFPSQAGPVVETQLWVLAVSGSGIATADYQGNADGTVTDDATGLMWDRCPWGMDWDGVGEACVGTAAELVGWSAALAASVQANGDEYLGHDDWRVPNSRELETLVELDVSSGPLIDTDFFPLTPDALFWSSTPYSAVPSSAWMVNFGDGRIRLSDSVTNTAHVRLVRGGDDFDYLAPAENGACGSADGVASLLAPESSALCAAGTPGAVTSAGGEHGWSCDGIGSGVSTQCTAPGLDSSLVGGSAGSVTLALMGGACVVEQADLVGAPAGGPPGVSMPYGAFQFELSNCADGATLEASFSGSVEGMSYWKYINDAWIEMPATLVGNTATFMLTDNGEFDACDDDGTICDPSGPGVLQAGGATAIPSLSTWAMLLITGVVGALGLRGMRRRSGREGRLLS